MGWDKIRTVKRRKSRIGQNSNIVNSNNNDDNHDNNDTDDNETLVKMIIVIMKNSEMIIFWMK